MNVDEAKAAATAVYKGKAFYFCSEGCRDAFEKEPAKYVTYIPLGRGRGNQ